MISNFACCWFSPSLAADAGRPRRIRRLVDGNVVFLLHALDQLFDELVEFAIHRHLLQAFAHFLVELIAFHQRLLDGAAQVVERLLALGHLVPHVALEAALQQVVGERAEQVFHAHFAGGVGNVFGVADAFHESGFRLRLSGFTRASVTSHSSRVGRSPKAEQQKPN